MSRCHLSIGISSPRWSPMSSAVKTRSIPPGAAASTLSKYSTKKSVTRSMIAQASSSSTITSTSICSKPRMYQDVSKMLPFQTMMAAVALGTRRGDARGQARVVEPGGIRPAVRREGRPLSQRRPGGSG